MKSEQNLKLLADSQISSFLCQPRLGIPDIMNSNAAEQPRAMQRKGCQQVDNTQLSLLSTHLIAVNKNETRPQTGKCQCGYRRGLKHSKFISGDDSGQLGYHLCVRYSTFALLAMQNLPPQIHFL